MTLGNRIRELRQKRGISQTKLAELIGSSIPAVPRWEADKSIPSTEFLVKIAQVFNVSTDYLLGLPTITDDPVLMPMFNMLTRLDRDTVQIIANVVSQIYKSKRKSKSLIRPLEEELDSIPIPCIRVTPSSDLSITTNYKRDFQKDRGADAGYEEFCVYLPDNSLSPYFSANDPIFMEKAYFMESGEIGLYTYDDKVYYRLFIKLEDGSAILATPNPEYKDYNIAIPEDKLDYLDILAKAIMKDKPSIPEYIYE